MIKKHNSLKRSENIINSFINSMYQHSNLDGVVEVFKQQDKQGYMVKLYKTFHPNEDLCFWVYEDLNKKTIHTVIGTHNNCDEMNNFIGDNLQYEDYLVVTNIKKQIVSDLITDIYNYYDKNMKI